MKKIAIVGFGKIAKKHIEVIRAFGLDVVASSNRSIKGNNAAKEYGIPKTYTNYIEMIEREQPEAIINCVSFDQIYNVTKELIKFRIPLLVEKPAGTSLRELDQLISLQKQFGTKVQVALNRRHYSVFHKAIEDAGGIDSITSISVEWSETPLRLLNEKGYTKDQVGKIIYGNSIHGIDMVTYFAGSILDYSTFTKSHKNFRWLMSASGISEGGKLFHFQSSWDNPVPWRMVFTSESKRYVFKPLEVCKAYDSAGSYDIEPDIHDIKYKAGFYSQMKDFIEGRKMSGLEDARPSMEIADKFYSRLTNDQN